MKVFSVQLCITVNILRATNKKPHFYIPIYCYYKFFYINFFVAQYLNYKLKTDENLLYMLDLEDKTEKNKLLILNTKARFQFCSLKTYFYKSFYSRIKNNM